MFQPFFSSSDNEFGFKKIHAAAGHAIYAAWQTVQFINDHRAEDRRQSFDALAAESV